MEDAQRGRFKVDVAARAVDNMGLGTVVEKHPRNLFDPDTVRAVGSCDVVFGCMDSIDGRHLLNKLATFYVIPYFDLGVKLEADGRGGVDQVCGTVHYLQPGGSSLLSRHVLYDGTKSAPPGSTAPTRPLTEHYWAMVTSGAYRRTGQPLSS